MAEINIFLVIYLLTVVLNEKIVCTKFCLIICWECNSFLTLWMSILQSDYLDNVSSPYLRTYSIIGASLLKKYARSLETGASCLETSWNLFFFFLFSVHSVHTIVSAVKPTYFLNLMALVSLHLYKRLHFISGQPTGKNLCNVGSSC